jgi:peptidoglycan/LPS O-acetylase OafA/YrhL
MGKSSTSQITETRLLNSKIDLLDGFRGLAILLVMGYHYFAFFSFGWVGVDMFFILSGFLISGKLIESVGAKRYFFSFYLKRILRVVPLYYMVLVLFFFFLPKLFPDFVSESFNKILEHQAVYWTFTVNIQDAFNGWPDNTILIHFWSLCCEMQFYLIWPFVVYLFRKKLTLFLYLLFVFFAGAFIFRLIDNDWFGFKNIYRYVLLPSRVDAFSVGAILYLLLKSDQINRCKNFFIAAIIFSFCGIMVIMFANNHKWSYALQVVSTYGYSLNAIFFGCCIGYALSSKPNTVANLFSGKLITTLGRYSYGMYIFHLPVYIIISKLDMAVIAKAGKFSVGILAFAITFFCAWTSFHLMEKHFLKLKPIQ